MELAMPFHFKLNSRIRMNPRVHFSTSIRIENNLNWQEIRKTDWIIYDPCLAQFNFHSWKSRICVWSWYDFFHQHLNQFSETHFEFKIVIFLRKWMIEWNDFRTDWLKRWRAVKSGRAEGYASGIAEKYIFISSSELAYHYKYEEYFIV